MRPAANVRQILTCFVGVRLVHLGQPCVRAARVMDVAETTPSYYSLLAGWNIPSPKSLFLDSKTTTTTAPPPGVMSGISHWVSDLFYSDKGHDSSSTTSTTTTSTVVTDSSSTTLLTTPPFITPNRNNVQQLADDQNQGWLRSFIKGRSHSSPPTLKALTGGSTTTTSTMTTRETTTTTINTTTTATLPYSTTHTATNPQNDKAGESPHSRFPHATATSTVASALTTTTSPAITEAPTTTTSSVTSGVSDYFQQCLEKCRTILEASAVPTMDGGHAQPPAKVKEFEDCATRCVLTYQKRNSYISPDGHRRWAAELIDFIVHSTSLWLSVGTVILVIVGWRTGCLSQLHRTIQSSMATTEEGSSEMHPMLQSDDDQRDNRTMVRYVRAARVQMDRGLVRVGQFTVMLLSMRFLPDSIAVFFPWSEAAAAVETQGLAAAHNGPHTHTRTTTTNSTNYNLVETDPPEPDFVDRHEVHRSSVASSSSSGGGAKIHVLSKASAKPKFAPKRGARAAAKYTPSSSEESLADRFDRGGIELTEQNIDE